MKFGAASARKLAQRYLREGDTVIDVGAADGFYTAIYAAQVKRAGWVLAIEPDLSNRLRLHRLMAVFQPITASAYALSDRSGSARFFCAPNAKHSSLFQANTFSDSIGIDVYTCTLDEVIQAKGMRPSLIQIDAQGAEAAILRGATRALKSKRAIWIIEVWRHGLTNAGACVADVIEPFKQRGYQPHDIRDRKLTWKQIHGFSQSTKPASHFNLVMVPAA